MIMPLMNGSQLKQVRVPYLSGGINTGSVGEAVADNQLTDCLNVWFQGGEVVTRPKLQKIADSQFYFDFDNFVEVETYIDGKKVKFLGQTKYAETDYGTQDNKTIVNIKSIIISADGTIHNKNTTSVMLSEVAGSLDRVDDICFYVGTPKAENSIGVYTVIKYTRNVAGYYFKYLEWKKGNNYTLYPEEFTPYAPQVIINGVGNLNSNLPRSDESTQPIATQLEGYNLLGNSYKASFTSDNISSAFMIPMSKNELDKTVTVTVDISGMDIRYRCNWTGDNYYFADDDKAGFYIYGSPFKKVSDKLKFNFNFEVASDDEILSDEILSTETYYIDGMAPNFYITDGSKSYYRYYYRCKFTGRINKKTGKLDFPMLKGDLKDCKFFFTKRTGNNVYDRFYDETINNSEAARSVTGKDENGHTDVTVDLTNAKLAIIDVDSSKIWEDENHSRCLTLSDGSVVPRFYTHSNQNYSFVFPSNGSIRNNIEVLVVNKETETETETTKIAKCKISEIYGGTVGQSYGTRSFVAGGDNKLYFSDIDNPYYFDENCYLGVGNVGEKITALKKQNGYLVIFKENSIYCTYETAVSTEELAAKVQNQSVVDIVAQYMYKIISVNSDIGCDLPKTIQLCMNKLVFGNKNGNVYTLNSISNYSERNIFLVSGLIKDKLQNLSTDDWLRAFSLDYNGYYILFIDDKAFCLNYNRNAFKYVGSYTTDSNVTKYGMFSWWIWQFPQYLRAGISNDTEIQLLLYDSTATYEQQNFTFNKLLSVPETEAESYIVSKFFDFSAETLYKSIERIVMEIGNDYETEISIDLLTDSGTVYTIPEMVIPKGTRGTPSYLKTKTIRPKIRLCRKFGFRIYAKGPLSLSAVNIYYTLKGSVKNGR